MVNTGTWNSDLMFWFLGAFLLPIFMHIFVNLCVKVIQAFEHINQPPCGELAIDVYQEVPKRKIPKPVKRETPKPIKEDDFRSIAINGLVDLGFSRSDARRRVAMLCSKNKYKKAEHLIVDAVRCV